MAALSHPNIVPIFDVGPIDPMDRDSGLYIAMELVDGEILDRWLDESVTRTSEVLEFAGRALRSI